MLCPLLLPPETKQDEEGLAARRCTSGTYVYAHWDDDGNRLSIIRYKKKRANYAAWEFYKNILNFSQVVSATSNGLVSACTPSYEQAIRKQAKPLNTKNDATNTPTDTFV